MRPDPGIHVQTIRILRQNGTMPMLILTPKDGAQDAPGVLCAALCMMARDYGEVPIAYQMPLYPMLDNLDTESSRDNHVYPTDIHAFDMMRPELPISEQATRRFLEEFQYARAHDYTGV